MTVKTTKIDSAPNFLPDLLQEFASMLDRGEHCDLTLKCSDGVVLAPGPLLASVSPVIRKLGVYLTSEMEATIILPDWKSEVVREFVKQL